VRKKHVECVDCFLAFKANAVSLWQLKMEDSLSYVSEISVIAEDALQSCRGRLMYVELSTTVRRYCSLQDSMQLPPSGTVPYSHSLPPTYLEAFCAYLPAPDRCCWQ